MAVLDSGFRSPTTSATGRVTSTRRAGCYSGAARLPRRSSERLCRHELSGHARESAARKLLRRHSFPGTDSRRTILNEAIMDKQPSLIELARALQVLDGKIHTLEVANARIKREAQELALAIRKGLTTTSPRNAPESPVRRAQRGF